MTNHLQTWKNELTDKQQNYVPPYYHMIDKKIKIYTNVKKKEILRLALSWYAQGDTNTIWQYMNISYCNMAYGLPRPRSHQRSSTLKVNKLAIGWYYG